MRTLAIVAVAVTTLSALAAPVSAAPAAPAAGTTTTTRSDCSPGGRLVVEQTRLRSGATRVVIAGHGVTNGRWKGGFAPDASSADGDVPLDVTATHHEFRTKIVVEGVTGDTSTTLLRGSVRRSCAVGQTVRPRTTTVSSVEMAVVARQQASGDLKVVGAIVGCVNGSSWRFALAVEVGDDGFGGGGSGATCRKHLLRIPPFSASDISGPPTALSLVARSGGDVRRISYRTSTPTG